jgi:hypothetical protein
MREALGWVFRDRRTGRVVVGQFPNLSLSLFVACRGVGWAVHPDGAPGQALTWAGTAALIWWSTDEIVRGVNPFRRGLGVAGMAFAIAGLISA